MFSSKDALPEEVIFELLKSNHYPKINDFKHASVNFSTFTDPTLASMIQMDAAQFKKCIAEYEKQLQAAVDFLEGKLDSKNSVTLEAAAQKIKGELAKQAEINRLTK